MQFKPKSSTVAIPIFITLNTYGTVFKNCYQLKRANSLKNNYHGSKTESEFTCSVLVLRLS